MTDVWTGLRRGWQAYQYHLLFVACLLPGMILLWSSTMNGGCR